MNLIRTIQEKDIGITEKKKTKFVERKAARAVLFKNIKQDKKIALIFSQKHNFHKIPGGGVDEGESLKKALKREVREETGCDIEISEEIGKIVEYRDEFCKKQINYCFIGDVKGKIQKPKFTKREISQDFKLEWVDLDKAIEIFKADMPDNYEGRFVVLRELEILKKAKEMIK